jgi:hypothetical protein
MRWFKALGMFESPKWVKKDWELIRMHLPSLADIRDEEKTEREITSIMRGYNPRTVLGLMCKSGASKYLNLTCD